MEPKKPRRPRRSFTDEFKASAARRVIDGGKTVAEVARDLDLVPSALGAWVEQARADAGKSNRGTLTSDEKAELVALRKRVRELEIDKAILKKAAAFFAKENGEVLVHPRGEGRAHSDCARAREDRYLAVKVAEAHARGRGKYGSPRVHRELAKQKLAVSRKRVVRLMQEQGLVGRAKKKFVVTTQSNHELETAPNLLDRDFTATAPDQKWAGDITYLKTPEGWLYLAVIIDLYSRFIVGWALSPKIDRHLVLKALTMATKRRGRVAGRLFHSDRGSQYASEEHRKALVEGGFTCSMSRRGNCLDNAVSESWFSTLKTELGERFASHDDAEVQLFDFIEVFYNQQRSHSTLGYVSPAEFERARAAA